MTQLLEYINKTIEFKESLDNFSQDDTVKKFLQLTTNKKFTDFICNKLTLLLNTGNLGFVEPEYWNEIVTDDILQALRSGFPVFDNLDTENVCTRKKMFEYILNSLIRDIGFVGTVLHTNTRTNINTFLASLLCYAGIDQLLCDGLLTLAVEMTKQIIDEFEQLPPDPDASNKRKRRDSKNTKRSVRNKKDNNKKK